ncbi:hypothetical protein D049_1039 [Vibrio parahaemolyticus VPTS-2010]|nr:hypothetical protein D049_1039 [Vibrio parahaemolyticus VPTS-2010]
MTVKTQCSKPDFFELNALNLSEKPTIVSFKPLNVKGQSN